MIQIIEDNERFEKTVGTSTLSLRRIPVDVHGQITERHTTREFGPTGQLIERVNQNGVLLDSVDYAVVGWKNVTHPVSKQAVPCTSENKRRLPVTVMELVMTAVGNAEAAMAGKVKADLTGLEAFLKARADYPGLNCETCRADIEPGDNLPNCAECPINGLVNESAEARQVYDIIDTPFFRAFPALVPDTLSLLLPPMTKEQAAIFMVKLSLIHQFRIAAACRMGGAEQNPSNKGAQHVR